MVIIVPFAVWIGGKEETGVLEDKRLISVVIWLQHAESKKPRRVTRSSRHGSRGIGRDNLFNHYLQITYSDENRTFSSCSNNDRGRARL
jgi:hypothetical protein